MIYADVQVELMPSCCQKIAVVTCGVAAVGKTTFALRLAQLPKTTVVHYDRILDQLGISTLAQSQAKTDQAQTQMLAEIKNALSRHDLVVVDKGLLEKDLRIRILTEIQKLVCACVLVVFPIPSPAIASVRLAKKKRLFRLTGNPIYSACQMENFALSMQLFEKPHEDEISKIVAKGAYVEFGSSLNDTRIQANEILFPSWQELETQILKAYRDVIVS
jgi:predicted kinase